MPQLGESVTEGTVGQWFKKIGDPVAQYEPLLEVVTDKVTAEVPSDFDGILQEICVAEGDTVSVGTVLCRLATTSDATPPVPNVSGQGQSSESEAAKSDTNVQQSGAERAAPSAPAPRPSGRFSPAVLSLAQEHDVDLADVAGSGEGGRITRKDVLVYLEHRQSHPAAATEVKADTARGVQSPLPTRPPAPNTSRSERKTESPDADVEVVEATAIRKIIARRMVDSKHDAPHAWTMVEADVTRLAQFRDATKVDFKRREGVDLTYLPFFIKAAVEALKRFPEVNASWVDGQIHFKKRIHISIAVATDAGLAVPVIHDADNLSIAGLAHRINELAAKARSGRLTVDDVQGGTFTVNNTGAFGSVLSQPIINAPQAAILSCESIVKRPVVVNDAIAIRSMVNLCMSLDHRVLDGWVAGQFLQAVRERLCSFGAETVLY
ncbi:2-oxo acid dehydrogenase subunit E2 [Alicyclobacillus sp. ALC3]|nr:2-oxo acid dehydrogenase subunit E2 [Alicyclobacillus sp. ALC3]